MHRRSFLQSAAAAAAWTQLGPRSAHAEAVGPQGRFKLKYAPHFGMFKQHAGDDLVDQLKFMADEGFVALEDNGMPRRDVATQERLGQAMRDLGIEMGVFVAHADFGKVTFATQNKDAVERIERDMRQAVEVAQRVGAKWCTVVPGTFANNREMDYQTADVIDNLRRAADITGEAGLTIVLEPLNHWSNHPGVFLTKMPQAFLLCRGADHPHCKILDDLYHQQITEGHLIRNLDHAWSEIAYIQVGDNPGRKEPNTGEIHYRNVFRHLHRKGYTGIVGMEHGNSRPGKDGERAVIDAYVDIDSFETN